MDSTNEIAILIILLGFCLGAIVLMLGISTGALLVVATMLAV